MFQESFLATIGLSRSLQFQLFYKVPTHPAARSGSDHSPKNFFSFPNIPILSWGAPLNQMDSGNDSFSHPGLVQPARHLGYDNRGRNFSDRHYLVARNSCVRCNFPSPETLPVG